MTLRIFRFCEFALRKCSRYAMFKRTQLSSFLSFDVSSRRLFANKVYVKDALKMRRPDIYHPNSIQYKTHSLESKIQRKKEIHVAPTYDKENQLSRQALFAGDSSNSGDAAFLELQNRYDKAVKHVQTLEVELTNALTELEAIRHYTKSQLENSTFYSALKAIDAVAANLSDNSSSLPSFLTPCPIEAGDVIDASFIGIVDAVNWHEVVESPFNQKERARLAEEGDERQMFANCRVAAVVSPGIVFHDFMDTGRRALVRPPKVILEVTSEEGSESVFKFVEGLEMSSAHEEHFGGGGQ